MGDLGGGEGDTHIGKDCSDATPPSTQQTKPPDQKRNAIRNSSNNKQGHHQIGYNLNRRIHFGYGIRNILFVNFLLSGLLGILIEDVKDIEVE